MDRIREQVILQLMDDFCGQKVVQRAWWAARKNSYSPEFQKFLSETKLPGELSTLNELFG